MELSDDIIIKGLKNFDAGITKKYFYGICRHAYNIFNRKYDLTHKSGLDFYSLAHDFYIRMLKDNFTTLDSKPKEKKLAVWMMSGFRFTVLDALKAYNKEYGNLKDSEADLILNYVMSDDSGSDMLGQIAEAVATHYHDRKMQEIAYMVLYSGYKQKEVAEKLGMTPAAVNQRYRKMMEEVIVPYVMENYSDGICNVCMTTEDAAPGGLPFYKVNNILKPIIYNMEKRTTPKAVIHLEKNEIFVFGSNLEGIHAGGAARTARLLFGAEMGNGVGRQGQSYAIPTMQGNVETIRPYVGEFIDYAKAHPELHFLVTPIGCGIAGFDPEDIAPLFEEAAALDNISLPEVFWDNLSDI